MPIPPLYFPLYPYMLRPFDPSLHGHPLLSQPIVPSCEFLNTLKWLKSDDKLSETVKGDNNEFVMRNHDSGKYILHLALQMPPAGPHTLQILKSSRYLILMHHPNILMDDQNVGVFFWLVAPPFMCIELPLPLPPKLQKLMMAGAAAKSAKNVAKAADTVCEIKDTIESAGELTAELKEKLDNAIKAESKAKKEQESIEKTQKGINDANEEVEAAKQKEETLKKKRDAIKEELNKELGSDTMAKRERDLKKANRRVSDTDKNVQKQHEKRNEAAYDLAKSEAERDALKKPHRDSDIQKKEANSNSYENLAKKSDKSALEADQKAQNASTPKEKEAHEKAAKKYREDAKALRHVRDKERKVAEKMRNENNKYKAAYDKKTKEIEKKQREFNKQQNNLDHAKKDHQEALKERKEAEKKKQKAQKINSKLEKNKQKRKKAKRKRKQKQKKAKNKARSKSGGKAGASKSFSMIAPSLLGVIPIFTTVEIYMSWSSLLKCWAKALLMMAMDLLDAYIGVIFDALASTSGTPLKYVYEFARNALTGATQAGRDFAQYDEIKYTIKGKQGPFEYKFGLEQDKDSGQWTWHSKGKVEKKFGKGEASLEVKANGELTGKDGEDPNYLESASADSTVKGELGGQNAEHKAHYGYEESTDEETGETTTKTTASSETDVDTSIGDANHKASYEETTVTDGDGKSTTTETTEQSGTVSTEEQQVGPMNLGKGSHAESQKTTKTYDEDGNLTNETTTSESSTEAGVFGSEKKTTTTETDSTTGESSAISNTEESGVFDNTKATGKTPLDYTSGVPTAG